MVNVSRWKVGEGHLKIFVRKHEGQRNLNKDKKILKLAGHRIHKQPSRFCLLTFPTIRARLIGLPHPPSLSQAVRDLRMEPWSRIRWVGITVPAVKEGARSPLTATGIPGRPCSVVWHLLGPTAMGLALSTACSNPLTLVLLRFLYQRSTATCRVPSMTPRAGGKEAGSRPLCFVF